MFPSQDFVFFPTANEGHRDVAQNSLEGTDGLAGSGGDAVDLGWLRDTEERRKCFRVLAPLVWACFDLGAGSEIRSKQGTLNSEEAYKVAFVLGLQLLFWLWPSMSPGQYGLCSGDCGPQEATLSVLGGPSQHLTG